MSDEIITTSLMSRLGRIREKFSSIRSLKNFKLISTMVLVLAVPLTVVLALQFQDLRQRAAAPATAATPSKPDDQKHPINFSTPQVILKADDFYIMANGVRYNAQVENVQVHSDPGSSSYTTLELIWYENNTEMRVNMYFSHQPNDFWRVSEVRTYNAQTPGDWIYYKGFVGNSVGSYLILPVLDLKSDPTNPNNKFSGSIHFENIWLQPFLTSVTPVISEAPTSTPTATLAPTKKPSLAPTKKLTPTPAPSVSVILPINNSRVMAGRVTQVAASASDGASVKKLEFYAGTTHVCSSIRLPLRCTWAVPAKKGVAYNLTAKALYKNGSTKTSSVVKVTSY